MPGYGFFLLNTGNYATRVTENARVTKTTWDTEEYGGCFPPGKIEAWNRTYKDAED